MSFERPIEEIIAAACYHKDSNSEFIKEMYKIATTNPHEITTKSTDFGVLVNSRASAVIREVYKVSGFIRLMPYPEMLLVGHCQLEHNSGSLIAQWLASRYEKFIILIIADEKVFLQSKRMDIKEFNNNQYDKTEKIIEEIRKVLAPLVADTLPFEYTSLDFDAMWEEYYHTQFLEHRLNLKQFHSFLPKYFFKKAFMKTEKDFYEKIMEKKKKTKTLDYFLN